MKVAVDNAVSLSVTVGDIIEFKHKGTAGEHGFYLVCHTEDKGYFIVNLSGKKKRMAYYESLGQLLRYHDNKIEAVYPAAEFQIKLERV